MHDEWIYADFAEKVHYHYGWAEENHSHSADEITYNTFGFGGFGTLQSEISSLKIKMSNKADSYHSHF